MKNAALTWIALCSCALGAARELPSGEALRRWQVMNQIRREKFDRILPPAMRENRIDMWITVVKEGYRDPLYFDLGEGYVSSIGYYIFTDRGKPRIERAALGINGYRIEQNGAYDIFGPASDLAAFVRERDPKRIGLNISRQIGAADGLSHASYQQLSEALGPSYAARFISAEKLISDFRSRRTAAEVAAFTEAADKARRIAEEALSNRVIQPDVTTLEEVAWWMNERLLAQGLESSFGMPSVYVTGPKGIEATSSDRIIRRGDLLMIDWGVGLMNFFTDLKRIAYVLRPGEKGPPNGIQHAFEQALKVRGVVKGAIRPGITAQQNWDAINEALKTNGFAVMKEFNRPTQTPKTEVIVGCHSVGNLGHGIGPSIASFNPVRMTYVVQPGNLLSIEFFAYTAAPEWGGAKVRIPLEDDAVVTANGVEWLYPVIERILLVK